MSAQIIGTVQTVIGHVTAVNKDGEVRELKSGDVLFQGETIKTGPDGSATILYANGLSQTIDSDADIKLNLAMADFMTAHAVMPMHPLTSAIHSAVLAESGLPKLFPDLKLAPMLASEGDHAAYMRPYLEPLGLVDSGYPTHGIPFGKMYALDVKGWPFLHHEIQIIPPVLLGREVTVYESGLPDGSNQLFGVTASGNFTITDPSHVIQLFDALRINGGAPVLLSALNNFHVTTPHGDLTLSYDNTTHTISFLYELTSPTVNLPGAEQDIFSLSLSAGSFTVNGQLIVNIIDDKPSVSMLVDGEFSANLVTHDALTIGAAFDTATANFSGAFTALPIYGADGAGSTVLNYSFDLLNSVSGLKSGGLDIHLFKVGNMIIGTTANSAPAIDPLDPSLIFTIAVDGSGNVTLTQYAQLDHALPGDSSNYDAQQLLLPGNLIHLVANAVTIDSDGVLADRAFASASLDLGGRVLFADDGPSIAVSVRDDSELLLTTHDASTPNTDSAIFANLFFPSVLNFGADGPYALSQSQSLELMGADGELSNLKSHGANIYLYKIGDVIVGSTAHSAPASVTDASVVFSVALSSQVILTQYAPIDHALPGDSSSYDTQHAVLDNGLIKLVSSFTAVDFDRDTATASNFIDLGGNIRFADDGPFVVLAARAGDNTDPSVIMVTNDHDAVYSSPSTATADFSGYFLPSTNYGADGPAVSNSLVVSYSLSLTAPGEASGLASHSVGINLYEIGGVVVGSTALSAPGSVTDPSVIFSIAVDSNSGIVTLMQYAQLDHSMSTSTAYSLDRDVLNNGLVNLVATAVITDFDGDRATNSNHIDLGGNIKFADDGPSGSITLTGAMVVVDETPGVNGPDTSAPAGTLGQTVVAYSSLVTDNILFGADGPAISNSKTFALQINGGDGTASGFFYSPTNEQIVLMNNAGVIEGHVGSVDGALAFTVAVDTVTGQITLTQYLPVEHSNTSDNNELSGGMTPNVLQLMVTATDFDGDSLALPGLDVSSVIQFRDDGPSGSVALKGGAAIVVDESAGVNGPDISAPVGTLGQTIVAYSSLVNDSINFGSDGPAAGGGKSFTLQIVGGDGTASGFLYSATNASIVLLNNAGVIEGHVGSVSGALAFTVAVDTVTGQVTLTQYLAVEHSNTSSNDELSGAAMAGKLQMIVTATDSDGDSLAMSPLDLGSIIQFRDDGPTNIYPVSAYLNDAPGATFTGALDFDSNLSNNFGSDGGAIFFPSSLNSAVTGLTSGGLPITYTVSGGGLILTASTTMGTVFTVTLQPGTSDYVVNMVGVVDGAVVTVDFNFGGYDFVGGNGSWAGFNTAANDNSQDILLTPMTGGINGGTVNTSADAGGVGSGNSVGSGEAMRVDFVVDLTGSPVSAGNYLLLANQTHAFESHWNTNGALASFTSITGGGPNPQSTVLIKTFDDFDSNPTIGDGTLDSVTRIVIRYNGSEQSVLFADIGTAATNYTVGGNIFTVLFVDLDLGPGVVYGARIAGVVSDTQIATYTSDGFSSIEYHYVTGQDFKIGDFGTTATNPGATIDTSLPVSILDNDGDPASGTIHLSFEPAALAGNDTLTGTANADTLYGGAGNDSIDGGGGNDTLYGGSGDDSLIGGSGNDTLIGGAGNDTLTGGTGADTFVWNAGDQGTLASPAVDTVMDFSMAEGDKINLSALLPSGAVSNPQNYLQFSTNGSDTVLKIDVGGAVSGSNFEQEIVFHNVSMSTLAGGAPSPTSADVINNMITTSHLVV
jgi:hypothetical protein